MALLEAAGFSKIGIGAVQGRERSDPREDIYRWEGYAFRGLQGVSLYSWDTMTECVARGIVATNKNTDGGSSSWQISAS